MSKQAAGALDMLPRPVATGAAPLVTLSEDKSTNAAASSVKKPSTPDRKNNRRLRPPVWAGAGTIRLSSQANAVSHDTQANRCKSSRQRAIAILNLWSKIDFEPYLVGFSRIFCASVRGQAARGPGGRTRADR